MKNTDSRKKAETADSGYAGGKERFHYAYVGSKDGLDAKKAAGCRHATLFYRVCRRKVQDRNGGAKGVRDVEGYIMVHEDDEDLIAADCARHFCVGKESVAAIRVMKDDTHLTLRVRAAGIAPGRISRLQTEDKRNAAGAADGIEKMPDPESAFIDATGADLPGRLISACMERPGKIIYRLLADGRVLEIAACVDAAGLSRLKDDCAAHFGMPVPAESEIMVRTAESDPQRFAACLAMYLEDNADIGSAAADPKWDGAGMPGGKDDSEAVMSSFAVPGKALDRIAGSALRSSLDMDLADACACMVHEISAAMKVPSRPDDTFMDAIAGMLAALQMTIRERKLDAKAIAGMIATKADAVMRKYYGEPGNDGKEG